MTGPLLPFAPTAVEIRLELNSTCSGLFWGYGDSWTLGEGEGSAEGLALGAGVACNRGRGVCCCATPELNVDWFEFSGVVSRVIVK